MSITTAILSFGSIRYLLCNDYFCLFLDEVKKTGAK